MLSTDHFAIASRLEGVADYGHGARRKRAARILRQMLRRPSASIPVMMDDPHQAKRCYAFLSNPMVLPGATRRAAYDISAERCRGVPTVLLIGDDTQLDLTTHPATGGLGPIGDGRGLGLLLHGLLAVDAATHEVLGLADAQVWARDAAAPPTSTETTIQRRRRDRESQTWERSVTRALPRLRGTPLDTTHWIFVGDCGADIFGYMATCRDAGAGFVQRAYHNRALATVDARGRRRRLHDAAAAAPVVARETRHLPAVPGRAARTATLHLHATTVTLAVPEAERIWTTPLTVNVVYVIEVDAPPGVEPLAWLLLTSEPIATPAQVHAVVAHYEARWLIEEWHMGLKTGCRIEERQLESRHAVENFLSLAMIVASELLRLRDAARRDPKVAAASWLRPELLTVLRLRRPRLAADATLHEAMRAIGQLGGFMGPRRATPGWRTLWLGFQSLLDDERAFLAGVRHQQRESLQRDRK